MERKIIMECNPHCMSYGNSVAKGLSVSGEKASQRVATAIATFSTIE